MPPEGKESHRFDTFDPEFDRKALVGSLELGDFLVGGGRNDRSADPLTRGKWAIKMHAEPAAELTRIADGAPYALSGGSQDRLFFDAVRGGLHNISPYCGKCRVPRGYCFGRCVYSGYGRAGPGIPQRERYSFAPRLRAIMCKTVGVSMTASASRDRSSMTRTTASASARVIEPNSTCREAFTATKRAGHCHMKS